eukprot:c18553_g2_i6.p1 GENE.c18553_g2_i6~~c18553_g2_i6.p1  ORF type:complete len:183 (+),score=69.19 c18553_g2_i6:38-550(+)
MSEYEQLETSEDDLGTAQPVPLQAVEKTNRILMVLVDGSEFANKAFLKAINAKRPEDTLYICNAVRLFDTIYLDSDPDLAQEYMKRLEEGGKALCQYYVEECKKRKEPNCHQVIITSDYPKEEILKFAQEKGVDTIYVGPRGLSKVKRMLIGSFSQYIVNHATCDVVLVK